MAQHQKQEKSGTAHSVRVGVHLFCGTPARAEIENARNRQLREGGRAGNQVHANPHTMAQSQKKEKSRNLLVRTNVDELFDQTPPTAMFRGRNEQRWWYRHADGEWFYERLQSVELYANCWRQNEKVKKIPKSLQTVLHFEQKMY